MVGTLVIPLTPYVIDEKPKIITKGGNLSWLDFNPPKEFITYFSLIHLYISGKTLFNLSDGSFCSYQLAITFQKKVIEAWEGHGPNAEDELKEAYRILEQLKTKSCGSLPEQSPIKALPSSNTSSSNSNCQSDVSITER